MIKKIAFIIKNLREAEGITKYRLAKITGIDQAYIGQLEAGRVKHPRLDTLDALAKGLNVPPCIFFGYDIDDKEMLSFIHNEALGLSEENRNLLMHSINIIREKVSRENKYRAEASE